MSRRFVCIGVNHSSAPVALREQVAFSADSLARALPQLVDRDGVNEAVVVSTCNRVEIYVAGEVDLATVSVRTFLHEFHDVRSGALDAHFVHRCDDEALQHLFRVASSLDAVVVGEPQILGQVKDAFFHAVAAGVVGPVVTRAFHHAFTTAKRVRTETKIAASAANVASAGVDLASSIFGQLAGLGCVLVGAGDMGNLAARHFAHAGARLTIVNRSLERARALADEVGGTAVDLESLPRLLIDADVVLVSTGAPGFVLTAEMVKAVHHARRYRPLLVVDISVPRNADPRIAELDNCYVYDVDDLIGVVDTNLQKRAEEAIKAEAIIKDEIDRAKKVQASQRAVPVIKALREKLQQIAIVEANKTLQMLGDTASEKQRKSVEAMANAIISKVLHEPLMRLKEAAATGDAGADLLGAAATLFGLETVTEEQSAAAVFIAAKEAEDAHCDCSDKEAA